MRTGQGLAARQAVVEEKPRANHPVRPQPGGVRHDEPQGPHEVRRGAAAALRARRAPPRRASTRTARDSAARRASSLLLAELVAHAEIATLDQDNAQTAPRGVARNAHAVDPAADDEQIGFHSSASSGSIRSAAWADDPGQRRVRNFWMAASCATAVASSACAWAISSLDVRFCIASSASFFASSAFASSRSCPRIAVSARTVIAFG